MNDFGNKFVVITGCDTGFGHETAIHLDKMGVPVLATCLTKEGEQNLKSETRDSIYANLCLRFDCPGVPLKPNRTFY